MNKSALYLPLPLLLSTLVVSGCDNSAGPVDQAEFDALEELDGSDQLSSFSVQSEDRPTAQKRDRVPTPEPGDPGPSADALELEPVENGGALLDELFATCATNKLMFFFNGQGSGPAGISLLERAVEEDSLVLGNPDMLVAAISGIPFIAGAITLTLEGRDAETGDLVISGTVEGDGRTVVLDPLVYSPFTAPDYDVINTALEPGESIASVIRTSSATISGSIPSEGGDFEYALSWYLGYGSNTGTGLDACVERLGEP